MTAVGCASWRLYMVQAYVFAVRNRQNTFGTTKGKVSKPTVSTPVQKRRENAQVHKSRTFNTAFQVLVYKGLTARVAFREPSQESRPKRPWVTTRTIAEKSHSPNDTYAALNRENFTLQTKSCSRPESNWRQICFSAARVFWRGRERRIRERCRLTCHTIQ